MNYLELIESLARNRALEAERQHQDRLKRLKAECQQRQDALKKIKPEKVVDGLSYSTLKMCNCADCGLELLSRKYLDMEGILRDLDWPDGVPSEFHFIGGRTLGRPYCAGCLYRLKRRPTTGQRSRGGEDSPGQQGALRVWEDSSSGELL